MNTTVALNFAEPFTVFPLGDCLLLPHNALPLHIFEPRYRKLVDDALNADGILTMGTFAGPVAGDEYERGRPPLRPSACVALITHYEPLQDGRYLILLQGLCRARVLEEIPHEPYRRFLLKPYPTARMPESRPLRAQRAKLLATLHDPAFDGLLEDAALASADAGRMSTDALLDKVGTVAADGDMRYALLSEPRPLRRAALVARALEQLRKENAEPF